VSRPISQTRIDPQAELLVGFVNTRDVEQGTDAIATPAELLTWLAASGSGELAAGTVDEDGHERLLALRESLRALLRANNGGEVGDRDLAALRDAAERSRYRATVSSDGTLARDAGGTGLEAFEARLLLAIERIQAQGDWARLKACPTGDCQWAFFDTSRNRSRTWCSMDECGNRVKTRRYRDRRSAGSGAGDEG